MSFEADRYEAKVLAEEAANGERARFRAWLVEASEKAQRDLDRLIDAQQSPQHELGNAIGRKQLALDLLARYDSEVGQ